MLAKYRISPDRYAQVSRIALIALALIVATGSAVRLTGSGLSCPDWPECNGSIIAPGNVHSWIEYGNRLISGFVGIAALLAGIAALLRRPFRLGLVLIGFTLPLGIVAQAILGAQTVKHELEPGFVMAHFGLSYVILIAAVALAWLSSHEPGWRQPSEDRLSIWAVRALLPLGSLLVFLGTLTTAAGPHAGSAATGEVVRRVDFKGVDTLNWLIHTHGRLGTATGLATVAVWYLLRRRGFPGTAGKALVVMGCFFAAQGVVGLAQYKLALPPELVWLHVVLATCIWLSLLWAVAAAGRVAPRAAAK